MVLFKIIKKHNFVCIFGIKVHLLIDALKLDSLKYKQTSIIKGDTKSLLIARRVAIGRDRSEVASLTPMIFGNLAKRAIVSTLISMTLRPGML